MLMICVCVCVCEMMIINIYCLHSVVYDDSSGFVCIFWIFSHTKEIGLLHLNGRLFYFFYFFVTYTHECTWAFLLFVLTASTWRISWFFTCWPELCHHVSFGFVGCLKTGVMIYLFICYKRFQSRFNVLSQFQKVLSQLFQNKPYDISYSESHSWRQVAAFRLKWMPRLKIFKGMPTLFIQKVI